MEGRQVTAKEANLGWEEVVKSSQIVANTDTNSHTHTHTTHPVFHFLRKKGFYKSKQNIQGPGLIRCPHSFKASRIGSLDRTKLVGTQL